MFNFLNANLFSFYFIRNLFLLYCFIKLNTFKSTNSYKSINNQSIKRLNKFIKTKKRLIVIINID